MDQVPERRTAYSHQATHRLPTSMACADVLCAFSRASASSSGLMLDSWMRRVTSRPTLTRFSVGMVSPEKLDGHARQRQHPSPPPIREALCEPIGSAK